MDGSTLSTTDESRAPLRGARVLELGGGVSAAFCARLFADLGADVIKIEPPGGDATRRSGPFPGDRPDPNTSGTFVALNVRKRAAAIDLGSTAGRSAVRSLVHDADLVVQNLHVDEMESFGVAPDRLRKVNPRLVVACITPFGLTGPHSRYRGGDLVAFHTSGVARLLIGQVEDPGATPPVRAFGDQAEYVAGFAAACGAVMALYRQRGGGPGCLIDVSMQEAVASMAPAQLAQAAYGTVASRKRELDGGGTTVCVLPASDGYVAISPREEHQWDAWTRVMGPPSWAADPRFKDKPSRVAHWSVLYPLMCEWSSRRTRQEIVAAAQAAHVPGFPWATPGDHLLSPQLKHREFFWQVDQPGIGRLVLPGVPYGFPREATLPASPAPPLCTGVTRVAWQPRPARDAAPGVRRRAAKPSRGLPLDGVRVVDLSWVIAGPACTRYLASMGAEVLKIEAPGRADPGRPGRLHEVTGQNKLAVSLDLKLPADFDLARRLIRRSDVLVENFSGGVMERLGLGNDALRELNPRLVVVSASGAGRTGPDARMVAYGTLLQAYSGFSGLNGYPGQRPAIGMAWTDFVCGLALAFATVAALDERRRTGRALRIDLSMVETQLMTMPGPILEALLHDRVPAPMGNRHAAHAPHGVYRCAGDDRWLVIAPVTDEQWQALCEITDAPAPWKDLSEPGRKSKEAEIDAHLSAWALGRNDVDTMAELQANGVPAGASLTMQDLLNDPHLAARGFFTRPSDAASDAPGLPGLPWRWANGASLPHRRAPDVGEHDDVVRARFPDRRPLR